MGGGDPRRRDRAGQVHPAAGIARGDPRPLRRLRGRDEDGAPLTLYRPAREDAGTATGLDHEALRARLAELERFSRRVVCLAGYPTEEGCRFAVAWDRDDGRPCRAEFDLPPETLRAFLKRWRADGHLPVALTSYPSGESTRFAAVLRKDPGRSWEGLLDLTAEDLRDELASRAGRGTLPALLCGYGQDGAVRYAATWAGPAASVMIASSSLAARMRRDRLGDDPIGDDVGLAATRASRQDLTASAWQLMHYNFAASSDDQCIARDGGGVRESAMVDRRHDRFDRLTQGPYNAPPRATGSR